MVLIKKILRWLGMIFGLIIFGIFAVWKFFASLTIIFIFFGLGLMGIIMLIEHKESKQKNLGGVQQVYSDGRKTIESFGTRKEFAILRSAGREFEEGNVQKVRWSLYNRDKDESIDRDVERYERVSPYVYTKGEKGYTKLNYETAKFTQNEDVTEFSKEDQEIFKNLKRSKD